MCEGKVLKNVFRFKYLGSIFAADGDQRYDVRRRIGLAMARMGQLNQVFNSNVKFATKKKVYKTAVCSLFTYGCEAWNITEATAAAIDFCEKGFFAFGTQLALECHVYLLCARGGCIRDGKKNRASGAMARMFITCRRMTLTTKPAGEGMYDM